MPALAPHSRVITLRARAPVSARRARSMNAVRAFFGGGSKSDTSSKSAHDFTARTIDGKEVSVRDFCADKVCLIVNVASK